MPTIKAVSDWEDQEGVSVQEDEFFLREPDFPSLYQDARQAYASSERPFEPIEQLSPKGLALLSALYAEKDGSEKQPVIASTSDDFKRLVALVAKASPGTKVTVIFQMTDAKTRGVLHSQFGDGHKTVCKLERDESGVSVIHMDSTDNDVYSAVCMQMVTKACQREGVASTFYFQRQLNQPSGSKQATFSRQVDGYQCGVFAVKDARELNRDDNFLDNLPNSEIDSEFPDLGTYDLPARSYKSVQSRRFSAHVLAEQGDQVVTRRGRTLRETHEKHNVSGYVQHFSQKFHDAVTEAVSRDINQPEKIREAVQQYDAAHMTPQRLQAVYGPENHQAAHQARFKNVVEQIRSRGEAGEADEQQSDDTDTPRQGG